MIRRHVESTRIEDLTMTAALVEDQAHVLLVSGSSEDKLDVEYLTTEISSPQTVSEPRRLLLLERDDLSQVTTLKLVENTRTGDLTMTAALTEDKAHVLLDTDTSKDNKDVDKIGVKISSPQTACAGRRRL